MVLGKKTFNISGASEMRKKFSAADIKKDLEKYLGEDSWFRHKIDSELSKRLKIATGELKKSIKFDVDVQVKQENNGYEISLSVWLSDIKKLPALLDDKEALDQSEKTPSLQALVRYVESKRKYFKDAIDKKEFDEKEHQRRRLIQRTQDRIGNISNHYKQAFIHEFRNPTEAVAKDIRDAIQHRLSSNKSATRGSTSVLLGFIQPQMKTLTEKNKKNSWKNKPKPFYTEIDPPLYTLIEGKSGVLNEIIDVALDRFMKVLTASITDIRIGKEGEDLFDALNREFGDLEGISHALNATKNLEASIQEKEKRYDIVQSKGRHPDILAKYREQINQSKHRLAEIRDQIYHLDIKPSSFPGIMQSAKEARTEANKIRIMIIGRRARRNPKW